MQTRTDAELLNDYVFTGDDAVFGELVARHGAFVHRTCFRLLKDEHEAQDACQTVFLVLAQKARRLQGGDLSAWLYRVAHLAAAKAVRNRMRRACREERYAADEPGGGEVPVQNEVDRQAVLDAVDAELMALSGKNREAVLLRYLRGQSQEAAARLTGCSVSTLSVRASRGIEELRRRLAKRGIALGVPVLAAALASEAQAAIPEALLSSILTAVKASAAGTAATAAVSANVAALTKGVLNMMFWNSVKTAAVAVAASVVVAGGGVIVAQEVAQRKVVEQPPTLTQAAMPVNPATNTSTVESVENIALPDTVGALFRYGQQMEKQGNHEKAIDCLLRIAHMPQATNNAALVAEAFFESAQIFRKQLKQPDKAADCYHEAASRSRGLVTERQRAILEQSLFYAAEIVFQQEKWGAACDLYAQLLKMDSKLNVSNRFLFCQAKLRADGGAFVGTESEEDLALIRKRIADNPNTLTALQSEIFLLDRKMARIQLDHARERDRRDWTPMQSLVNEYADLLKKYPSDVIKQQGMRGQIIFCQATCYWQAGDLTNCQNVLEPFMTDSVLRTSPMRAEALFMLARTHIRQNLPSKALNVLQTVMKDHEDFKAIEEVYTEHARAAIEVSEWAVAADTCKRFAAKFPNSERKPYLERYAAAAQIGSGNAEAGAATLRRLTKTDTFEDVKADAYYRLAMLSLRQPQPDKAAALDLLRKSVACHPDAKSLLLAATCACDLNDWPVAREYVNTFTRDFSKADRAQLDAMEQLRRRIPQASAQKTVGGGTAN